ncbi:MmRce1 family CPBP family CAAX prenyl protease [Methanolobus sp.]|uniref:MmRce1 family CPBP family CAAX prenyl protease n=1 Tax=Methanolobus sp. TaxID=1874737 RepID=UPI0025E37BD4|nr:MmRce1 family CPBP family CAAX prenyl protease [Methanolobus sp.]
MIPNYKYKPGIYYLSIFIITFALWFAGAYMSFRDDGNGLYMLVLLPGLMAPFLISLFMIYRSNNADLKKDFINRLINIRLIHPNILPVFFLLMPLVVLLSTLISIPLGEPLSQFQFAEGFSFSAGAVPVLLILLLAASFEELGWRGYAFDSLQSRHTYFTASLIFSVLWSLWHFPLIFVNNSYQYEIFNENFWYGMNFFVSIVPMGMIISWICIKNGKSIIAAMVFHFIINMSQELLDITQNTKCIETVVLIFVAVLLIAYDREMFFSRKHLAERTE